MSKVLVDRGLLAECVSVCIRAFGVGDPIEAKLRAILAQPAEAEGARDYLTEFAEGEVEAKTAIEDLQDAIYAVTAERDQSISLTADYIAMLGEAGLQIDQLTAERDALAARLGEWERSKLAQIMRENVELTAERDKINADRKACWEEFKALVKSSCEKESYLQEEIDRLRAEVESLRPIHAMILNALDRDAEEGRAARGEMAAELRAAMAAKEA